MKIGFIIFSGENFGGMERRYAGLVNYLINDGFDVSIFCTGDSQLGFKKFGIDIPQKNIFLLDRPGVKNVFLRKILRLFALFKFFVLLKTKSFSHVHIVANPGLISSIYNFINRFLPPFSISVVDSELKFTQTEINSLKGAVAVDCLSQTIKNYVVKQLPVNMENKIFVSPCSFIDYRKICSTAARDIDVTMIARFVPGKGYNLMASASSFLPSLNIHLCGFGPKPPRISNAKIYATNNSFSILARSKIFLSLQETENYPSQALLEAMASGCAIIATDVGETRRLLDDSCAILIDPIPSVLADSIKKLISDQILRDKLGSSAKERVQRLHNINDYSKYFLNNILRYPTDHMRM